MKVVSIESRKVHEHTVNAAFPKRTRGADCFCCRSAAVEMIDGKFENICQKGLPMDANNCPSYRDSRKPSSTFEDRT